MFPPVDPARHLWHGERYRHKKIRIAYVSPDLREHPVGHLMCGVFERHDKNRFETYAISLGIDDGSRLRARMVKAFDHFIDVRAMGSLQIAQLMREHEIDVAIDLAGYTSDSRTEVFSYRPVPAQVGYLGYPGTMAVPNIDYILADQYVIPAADQQYYTEQVVYLPDTYLPTDGSVKIAERTPTRAECGLPEQGIVFCSFSHDYKINPALFDIWMRILARVPGSVLWLMSRVEVSKANLRREAQARGIDPARLIFAERVPLVEDHLARYRQADLFLDTHPYNAHTTAADALMAGLPVLTYMGHSFPSRVAGSLLHALGMEELATTSFEQYEELAVRLASSPELLAGVKARTRANRDSYPLFDTERFCRNLEAVYSAMWRKTELGSAHDALSGHG
jgi:predicted O-linked N-acetylglucosamine transferase (SPINDLY family)